MSAGVLPAVARSTLRDDVVSALAASVPGSAGPRLGLEYEVIPVAPSGDRLPPEAPPGEASGRTILEAAARVGRWRCEPGTGGAPRFRLPGGGLFTFEPGGQIELSTAPRTSVDAVAREATDALRLLFAAADHAGVRLLAVGMDPDRTADAVPLVVDSERYRRQDAHYGQIGPWGRRMMRLSAAVHVNVDLGGRPGRRWSVANRAAPVFTAVFANSTRFAGEDTGFRSFRAEQWRRLDPSRTGLLADDRDPVGEYLAFALDARHFLAAPRGGDAPTFRTSWAAGAGRAAWTAHLTTLFPEVRPRGYLELRSFDALRPAWLAVPLVAAAGLLYDARALAEAAALLPPAEASALEVAGREGLAAPGLGARARDVLDLALEGAARLGDGVVSRRTLEVARAFRDRFTARGLDPGHEAPTGDPFSPG